MNSQVKDNKAQGLLEWVVLFCVAAAALIVISHYVRNSLSGRYRETADSFGKAETYRPFGNTTVVVNITNR